MSPKKRETPTVSRMLTDAIRGATPEELKAAMRKSAVLQIRLASWIKTDISTEAKRRGLSVSNYLVALHLEATGK